MKIERTRWTSREVCEMTGATYRQLDYWTRRGYVSAIDDMPGSGVLRRYDRAAVDRAELVVRLIGIGVDLNALGAAILAGELESFLLEMIHGLRDVSPVAA